MHNDLYCNCPIDIYVENITDQIHIIGIICQNKQILARLLQVQDLFLFFYHFATRSKIENDQNLKISADPSHKI